MSPRGKAPFPLAVLCGWSLGDKLPLFAQELPPVLLFSAQGDGDRDFTPWPAPGVREGEVFSGEGAAYLRFLTETALPHLEAAWSASPRREDRAILGYSLGGLFALWGQAQSGAFQTAGSLSGSLWYPGWLDYLKSHPPAGRADLPVSGGPGGIGGPALLRAVGDCTRRTYALYEQAGIHTVLEWNKGGHGKSVDARWKKSVGLGVPGRGRERRRQEITVKQQSFFEREDPRDIPPGHSDAPPHPGGVCGPGASAGRGQGAAPAHRPGPGLLHDLLGAARGGKNHSGPDYRRENKIQLHHFSAVTSGIKEIKASWPRRSRTA